MATFQSLTRRVGSCRMELSISLTVDICNFLRVDVHAPPLGVPGAELPDQGFLHPNTRTLQVELLLSSAWRSPVSTKHSRDMPDSSTGHARPSPLCRWVPHPPFTDEDTEAQTKISGRTRTGSPCSGSVSPWVILKF